MRQIILSVLCLVLFGKAFSQEATLYNLGSGSLSGVSPNGLIAVGFDWFSGPFVWTEGTGKIVLGDAEAYAVTNDTMVVGRFRDPNTLVNGQPTLVAGYWKNGEWTSIGGLPGVDPFDTEWYSHGYGVSDDGSTIVGMGWLPNYRVEAFYWTEATGIVSYGQDGGYNSRANDANADGSIVVGWDGEDGGPDRRAYKWDPEPYFLGSFSPPYPVGESRGISPNGAYIVGQADAQPFVWTEADGMQRLIDETVYPVGGAALGVTDDGTIVGFVSRTFSIAWAFYKPAGEDLRDLGEYLATEKGVEGLEKWNMYSANGISADGQTIAGWGINKNDDRFSFQDAYLVRLTPPVSDISVEVNIDSAWLPVAAAGDTIPVNITLTNNSQESITTDFRVHISLPGGLSRPVRARGSVTLQGGQVLEKEKLMKVIADGPSGTYKVVAMWGDYLQNAASFSFEKTGSTIAVTRQDAERESIVPVLEQNSPNPFNPSTRIAFTLPEQSVVTLEVFNMLGQRVAVLADGVRGAGTHNVTFNASNLASGIYIYRLQTPGFVTTKKLMLMK
ncbi:MAG: T9SS type A sorting domain-containing protein [Ignavibacteria bacterium]|nr:T9SS type A sorting domain-containing protein [Ignavibacteria bacterium]